MPGIQARSRALLSDGPTADTLCAAGDRPLGRSRIAVHLARAHLVYGEWLRREQRQAEARAPAGRPRSTTCPRCSPSSVSGPGGSSGT